MFLLLILSFIVNSSLQAKDKVIYGANDLQDISEVTLPLVRAWSESVAGMVKKDLIIDSDEEHFLIHSRQRSFHLCEDEEFAQKGLLVPECTGFLVGEDLLVTAGHCVKTLGDSCQDYQWVFNLNKEKQVSEKDYLVKKSDVFECKEILTAHYGVGKTLDYALIRLNKKAEEKKPFELNSTGDEVKQGDSVFVLGHPWGLPLKFNENIFVRANKHHHFFVINSDTFRGSSGSPVINAETGLVEGLMARGESDVEFDLERRCFKLRYCSDYLCRGEDITKSKFIKESIDESDRR